MYSFHILIEHLSLDSTLAMSFHDSRGIGDLCWWPLGSVSGSGFAPLYDQPAPFRAYLPVFLWGRTIQRLLSGVEEGNWEDSAHGDCLSLLLIRIEGTGLTLGTEFIVRSPEFKNVCAGLSCEFRLKNWVIGVGLGSIALDIWAEGLAGRFCRLLRTRKWAAVDLRSVIRLQFTLWQWRKNWVWR